MPGNLLSPAMSDAAKPISALPVSMTYRRVCQGVWCGHVRHATKLNRNSVQCMVERAYLVLVVRTAAALEDLDAQCAPRPHPRHRKRMETRQRRLFRVPPDNRARKHARASATTTTRPV
jgi:hypothetical protein